VAVNKMDLVDYRVEAFAAIVDDFLAFAQKIGIEDVRFVPLSALEGDMVVGRGDRMLWYEGPTLLDVLESAEIPRPLISAPLRFPVQYVTRPMPTRSRGYLGRIESGSIRVGDRITALPSCRTALVREIAAFEGSSHHAGLHAAVTLILDTEIDISRGDMLVHHDAVPTLARTLAATVCWLDEKPLDARKKYLVRHTTREVRARVDRIDYLWNVSTQTRDPAPPTLAMNDIGCVSFTLAQPVFADRYAEIRATGSFIVIDETTNNTVAAGMIQ